MSQVFIALYLDEDVDVLVAAWVRARGFDILTTRDAENLRTTDDEQLTYAVSKNRTLVTHNRVDFENLGQDYFTMEKTHCGVIFAVRRPP